MHKFQVHLVFTIIAAVLLMLGLNTIPLFDWDELNFAESAREMVYTNNWLYTQVGFEPFWEKPPLFYLVAIFWHSIGWSTCMGF